MADLQTALSDLEKALAEAQDAASAIQNPTVDPLRQAVETELQGEGWTPPAPATENQPTDQPQQ